MIFGQDRTELRRLYFEAWKKHRDGAALSALEAQIAQVVEDHSEYQQAVADDLERSFTVEAGETNPFLHMGLHLGIRDQVAHNLTRRSAQGPRQALLSPKLMGIGAQRRDS